MIQVCCYEGCGVVYGEKEPLSDRSMTHGLCPLHQGIALEELNAEADGIKNRTDGFRVLIVEDSALFRQFLRELLKDRFPSMEIDEAPDGETALLKAEAAPPSLIFMDIRLPGKNGLEVARRIKARYPKTIVVMLTGYDLPEYRNASMKYADYFFSKDTSTAEILFSIVQSMLPSHPGRTARP